MLQDSGMENKCWPNNGATSNPESKSGKSGNYQHLYVC